MNFDFGHMNNEQKEAVQHINGPCRVIAGAGSGKTTVLTKRIEYLLKNGISPKNILAGCQLKIRKPAAVPAKIAAAKAISG